MTRSYNHMSGLALALDTIGERWTLLILRSLLNGPRRFNDLQDELPGINTTLLSARLKNLSKLQVIRKRKLPPPASVIAYELDALGSRLEPVLLGLEEWGWALLECQDSDLKDMDFRLAWSLPMLKYIYDKDAAAGLSETYEVRIDAEVMCVVLTDGDLQAHAGEAANPVVKITMDRDTFMSLDKAQLEFEDALKNGQVSVKGDTAAAHRFFNLFKRHIRETN